MTSNRLYEVTKSRLKEAGYAGFSHFRRDWPTRKVAELFGSIVDIEKIMDRSSVRTIQTLKPLEARKAPENHYSGVFGLNEFPLHTDLAHWAMPPRYILLRCIAGDESVATQLLPVSALRRVVGVANLQRGLVKARRVSRYGTSVLLPLVFWSGNDYGLRWDSLFLTPMNTAANDLRVLMSNDARTWSELKEVFLQHPGDTLIVDNWRILHGRSHVEEQTNRIIERVYLSELNK